MIVVDASVLVNALADDGPIGQASRAELRRDAHWGAPEHVVVETFSAVRGLLIGRKISTVRARDAVGALASWSIDLVSTTLLLSRMWELRVNLTGYDAAYVSLAQTWGVPLLTADARLARAGDLSCQVRLVGSAG